MEYSAASVKFLLWYVETKETAKLLQDHTFDEIKEMVFMQNLYQQRSKARQQSEFSCIKKRLESIPDELIRLLIKADIQTAKLITFIACMATERLLFEMVYEIYRNKVKYGEEKILDTDLNVFFQDKRDQNEKIAGFSDETIRKLKQTFSKYMVEAGLISGKGTEKKIEHPYIDWGMRDILFRNHMEKYWYAITGEM